MNDSADIVIVGGGPVGAALASALSAFSIRALLIDPREPGTSPRDVRPIALSHGSRLILERLGVWERLQPATAIERIHVSQRGAFGRSVLSAREARVPALGYVVDYARVVSAFDAAVCAARVESVRGARVTSVDSDAAGARVAYATASGACEHAAALVVVADGGGLQAQGAAAVRDYDQTAITARLETTKPHRHIAYERFTPEGPIALLPYGEEYALVWTTRTVGADVLASAPPEVFLARLQECFGERAGRFIAVSERAAHPLSLRIAHDAALPRVITIGNAAQALHPVAGQGFNLGLRDAWELAREIREGGVDARVVSTYRSRRRIDRAGGIAFTDSLITLFSNDSAALAIARGAGLALIDNLPPVKDFLVRRMMFGARG